MAFGFPASYEETHRFNVHPDYLSAAVNQATSALGLRVASYTPYQIIIKYPFNLLSYGENMSITIYQDGTVHAKSEGVVALQWYDWGKNKKNVTNLFRQMIALSGYQPVA